MAGYWDEVEVHKLANKRTRPIFNHLDWTNRHREAGPQKAKWQLRQTRDRTQVRSLQRRLPLAHRPLRPQTPVFQPNRLGCYPWSTLTDGGLLWICIYLNDSRKRHNINTYWFQASFHPVVSLIYGEQHFCFRSEPFATRQVGIEDLCFFSKLCQIPNIKFWTPFLEKLVI